MVARTIRHTLAAGLVAVLVGGAACVSFGPKASERAYNKAAKVYWAENYRAAVTQFSDFLTNYPDSRLAPIARFYLADSYRELRLFQNALRAYDACLAVEPYPPLLSNILYHKGYVLEKLGRPDEAVAIYGQLVRDFSEAGSEHGAWVDMARQRLKRLGMPAPARKER